MFRRMGAALSAALLLWSLVPTAQAAAPLSVQLIPDSGQAGTVVAVVLPNAATFSGFTAVIQFPGAAAPITLGQWASGDAYVTAPADAASGTVRLTIVNSAGSGMSGTATTQWTTPIPAITSVIARSNTGAVCDVFAGGQPLDVVGENFGAIQGHSAVLIDGVVDNAVTWGSSSIQAVLPGGIAAGHHTVAVRTGGGHSNAVTIVTGSATSTGCGTTATPQGKGTSGGTTAPAGSTHGSGSATGPSLQTTRPTGSTATTTTQPSTPATLAISGPATLAVDGRGLYAVAPTRKDVTWASSDPAVATVTDVGLVTAHSAGTATISAISGGQGATKTVKVTPTPTKVTPSKPTSGRPSGPSGNGSRTPVKGHSPATSTIAGLLILLLVLLAALLFWLRRRPRRDPRPEPASHD